MGKIFLKVLLLAGFGAALGFGLHFAQSADRKAQDEKVASLSLGHHGFVNSLGQSVSLAKDSPLVKVVYFGYTFCPDVCPTTSAFIIGERRRYLEQFRKDFLPVFISVDPLRDDPSRLEEFRQHFRSRFEAWTGSWESLDALTRSIGAYYEPIKTSPETPTYEVKHTGSLFIFSPEGVLIATLSPPFKEGDLVTKLESIGSLSQTF